MTTHKERSELAISKILGNIELGHMTTQTHEELGATMEDFLVSLTYDMDWEGYEPQEFIGCAAFLEDLATFRGAFSPPWKNGATVTEVKELWNISLPLMDRQKETQTGRALYEAMNAGFDISWESFTPANLKGVEMFLQAVLELRKP